MVRDEGEEEPVSPHPCYNLAGKRQGQFSCAHTLRDGATATPTTRASSTVLPRQDTGPALLSAAAGEGRASSLSAEGSRGCVHRVGESLLPCHHRADMW